MSVALDSPGLSGFVLWFTGLSGTGKSTLAGLVGDQIARRGLHVERLDGDEVRKHLSRGLGFSKEDRDENIRRIGYVAGVVERCGAVAIVAAISPYRAVRDEIRRSVEHFVEVHVDCPLSVLSERDPKGLYKRALAGELKGFTGIDDPYEVPTAAELHLRTDGESPAESAARVVTHLERAGLLPSP